MEIKLNYIEKGQGMPLVLLHGNGEDSGYFVNQIEYFAGNYRVIAVDTRGHGKSPRGDAPFTLKQFAEDLKDFLDELGIFRVSLLGFSDGGNVALLFALKYPEYVEKLILNGANLEPGGIRAPVRMSILSGFVSASVISLFDKKALRKKELLRLMVDQPHITDAELESLDIPTLVIAGTREMIKTSHTRRIHAGISGSRVCILEGSHFVAMENSERFNKRVEDFLNRK